MIRSMWGWNAGLGWRHRSRPQKMVATQITRRGWCLGALGRLESPHTSLLESQDVYNLSTMSLETALRIAPVLSSLCAKVVTTAFRSGSTMLN